MLRWIRRIITALVLLSVVGAVAYSFLPGPVTVDLGTVSRGPLQVAVEEDGKTRIRDRYVVSAPLAGRLDRLKWRAGDAVCCNQPLAVIEPTDPALLDVRTIAQSEARVKGAKATLEQAIASLERAREMRDYAETEWKRAEQLSKGDALSKQEVDEKRMLQRIRNVELRQAQHAVNVAQFELELAEAAMLRVRPNDQQPVVNAYFEIPPPPIHENGHPLYVLRVKQESETVVTPGMPLLELGDPTDLEVEIDVLSSDAVKIRPGARVLLDQWGGDDTLEARVRLVEPSGFLKISALGVEEQRVNVIADFLHPEELPNTLRDSFRVEAQIIVWEKADVLRVPNSALFRHAKGWAVFRARQGRAVQQVVEIGRRNGLDAEVIRGLQVGDEVILHPSDKIRDGVQVKPR